MKSAKNRYLEMVNRDRSVAVQDESLHEHDAKYHGGHFDPKTMTCGKREKLAADDKVDGNVPNASARHNIGNVTPEEDAAYADAVKRGDRDTALRMIREAAAKAMPNTKVVDEDGLPRVMYRGDRKGFDWNWYPVGSNMFRAVLWASATKDFAYLFADEDGRVRRFFLNVKKPFDLSNFRQWEDSMSNNKELENHVLRAVGMSKTEFDFAAYKNRFTHDSTNYVADSRWVSNLLRKKRYDGVKLKEIHGDNYVDTFGVYSSSQIKSADITYDDNGNLIPLSKRFNMESADIRDEANGKVREYLNVVEAEDASLRWTSGRNPEVLRKRSRRKPIDRVPKKDVKAIIAENCKLIKTIDADMLPLVAGKVYAMLTGKLEPDEFLDWCVDECNIEEWQAYRIARDQIVKAQEQIKMLDWKKRGVNFVMWCHSGKDNEPREYHVRKWDGKSGIYDGKPNGLNGFVFRMDNPPIIDLKTMERGWPSSLIGCKCSLKGVRGV